MRHRHLNRPLQLTLLGGLLVLAYVLGRVVVESSVWRDLLAR
jgi:hypothetical protein